MCGGWGASTPRFPPPPLPFPLSHLFWAFVVVIVSACLVVVLPRCVPCSVLSLRVSCLHVPAEGGWLADALADVLADALADALAAATGPTEKTSLWRFHGVPSHLFACLLCLALWSIFEYIPAALSCPCCCLLCRARAPVFTR